MDGLDLVIFDSDGVLVDSEKLGNQVIARTLTECGYPITWEESIHRFMGGPLTAVRVAVEAETGRPLAPDFEQRYLDGLFEEIKRSLQPVDGIDGALSRLVEAGVPRCVASSGTHGKIDLALTTTGLLHHFDGNVFSGYDVAAPKPAPDLFLHAAASCGAAVDRCVVVEDSPTGVKAGRAAGMTVVGYVNLAAREQLEAAGADVIITSMHSLVDTLELLTGGALTAGEPAPRVGDVRDG